MYTRVEGFKEHAELIEKWCGDAPSLAPPVLAMVYGPGGCGRTSIAHYIYYKYLEGVRDPFSEQQTNAWLVASKVDGDHETLPVRDMLRAIYATIRQSDISLTGPFLEKLDRQYQEKVVPDSDPKSAYEYGLLFGDTRKNIKEVKMSLLSESVRSPQQLGRVLEAFKQDDVSTIIIFTTDNEDVYDSFVANQPTALAVKVREMTEDDTWEYLESRWTDLAGNARHPFPRPGIRRMHGIATKWPIQHITRVLYNVFREHLVALDKKAGPINKGDPALLIDDDFMFKVASDTFRQIATVKWARH
jgi:hypothetical protein